MGIGGIVGGVIGAMIIINGSRRRRRRYVPPPETPWKRRADGYTAYAEMDRIAAEKARQRGTNRVS